MTFRRIERCRLCGAATLRALFSLGTQALAGVFPRSAAESVAQGPLELVQCAACHLVQLAHSAPPEMLFGRGYGYRSALNAAMVRHLADTAEAVRSTVKIAPGDFVLDIGSNDGTLLRQFPAAWRVGIDPVATAFRDHYPAGVELIPEFFSADAVRARVGGARAKAITSIAMLYDLERPADFARDVAALLAPEGVWRLEQSYLPAMLAAGAYDAICHEHLAYYAFGQILRLTEGAGLKVIAAEVNGVNGGSLAVTACHQDTLYPEARAAIDSLLAQEAALGLEGSAPYEGFWERAERHREDVRRFFRETRVAGKTVVGYGASTKGNVLLQFCGIGPGELPCIAEVNGDKFGCFTPGTGIPIVSEPEARSRRPDYLFVLPWHFRESIIAREADFLAGGGRLVFPLPTLQGMDGIRARHAFGPMDRRPGPH